MRDDLLEATLADIGRRLAYPEPTRMADAVRARLRESRPARWRPRLVPALVSVALLVLVFAVASPELRASAREFLRLRGIDIFPVATVRPPTATPSVPFPGERVTLAEARTRAAFPIRVPAAADLGEPDEVYVETVAGNARVTLVYRERPERPASSLPGVAAVVVEVRGSVDELLLGKAAGPGTRIDAVSVGGAPGFWLEGTPHLFFYRDPSGAVRDETLRLAGNTLIWVADGVTVRLEAPLAKDAAIAAAGRFR